MNRTRPCNQCLVPIKEKPYPWGEGGSCLSDTSRGHVHTRGYRAEIWGEQGFEKTGNSLFVTQIKFWQSVMKPFSIAALKLFLHFLLRSSTLGILNFSKGWGVFCKLSVPESLKKVTLSKVKQGEALFSNLDQKKRVVMILKSRSRMKKNGEVFLCICFSTASLWQKPLVTTWAPFFLLWVSIHVSRQRLKYIHFSNAVTTKSSYVTQSSWHHINGHAENTLPFPGKDKQTHLRNTKTGSVHPANMGIVFIHLVNCNKCLHLGDLWARGIYCACIWSICSPRLRINNRLYIW